MDASLLGRNFPLTITMVNQIDQKKTYTILIETLPPFEKDDSGEVNDDGDGLVIEGLPLIEEIEIEFAHVDIRGLLKINFANYVLKN